MIDRAKNIFDPNALTLGFPVVLLLTRDPIFYCMILRDYFAF